MHQVSSRRSRWFVGLAVLIVTGGGIGTGRAQTLSAPSLSNASSANECTTSILDNPGFCRRSSTATLSSSALAFQTRYLGLTSADCGPACGPKTETLSSNYTVSFTATAPRIYRLQVDTRRTAGLTCRDEGTGNCQAVMGALACSPSGGTVTSGGCTLADPADNSTSGTSVVNVNQTNSLLLCGFSNGSPVNHSLNFTWSQSATTPGTGFISVNSDEAAVRLGDASNGDPSNDADNYPGVGSRTASNDGHFVTVTITNLCGNGVVDVCGANSEQCDQGALNGTSGSCCNTNCTFKTSGTVCRASAGVCDQQETCSGSSGTCPADTFLSAATPCRAAAGECDLVENCPGNGPNCPADIKKTNGTACTADSNPCSLDQCNGSSVLCQHPAGNGGATCRAAAGVCDVAETCTGSSTTCPADGFASSSTVCRASVGVCDLTENCTGSGPNCPADAKSTAVCRPGAGVCDIAESCNGIDDTCPADQVEPNTTVCRPAADVCDEAETCDGSSVNCPADAFQSSSVVCRPSAGICDVAENCTGSGPSCPADGFESSSTVCRPSAGVCDVAENCTGSSAFCPGNGFQSSSVVCRPSVDVCDVTENCTGSMAGCPVDGFASSATVCRPAAGVCDDVENCTGSGPSCPADAKGTGVCRPAAGVCDVAENCDGSGDNCPPDEFTSASAAFVCRPTAGVCDVAEICDGSGPNCPADAFAGSSVECRAVNGACDVAENCDGSGPNCPADAFASSSVVCRPTAGICDVAENCTGSSRNCPSDQFLSNSTVCRPGSGACDVTDNCPGNGPDCGPDDVASTSVVCRPAQNDCDAAENCDGTNKTCPSNQSQPNGTACTDGNACTQPDSCSGFTCVGTPVDCNDTNPCTDDACDSAGESFLCVYTNNGSCIGPNCGNTMVDAGETCDPPNLGTNPVTGELNCRLDCTRCGDGVVQSQNAETCDDGNTASGCRIDMPQKPIDGCLNSCRQPICDDPAKIKFANGPDSLSVHGRLITDVPVDFDGNHFVIQLSNNDTVLYRTSLLRASLTRSSPIAWKYKNKGAKEVGGLYTMKVLARDGYYKFTLKAYGDLSAAVADMTTQVFVGSRQWAVRGIWEQYARGWKFNKKGTFLEP